MWMAALALCAAAAAVAAEDHVATLNFTLAAEPSGACAANATCAAADAQRFNRTRCFRHVRDAAHSTQRFGSPPLTRVRS